MPRRTSRFRAGRTHGRGKKAGRGAGKRGGRGNAGLHKHKYMTVLKYDPEHFGRHGFNRPQSVVASPVTLNVKDLDEHAEKWAAMGLAVKKGAGSFEIDLGAMGVDKLLGTGSVRGKYKVKVGQASASAVEKIQGAGGSVQTVAGPSDK